MTGSLAVPGPARPARIGRTARELRRNAVPHSGADSPAAALAAGALAVRQALRARSGLDPELWFPASPDPVRARREAAAAIAICRVCAIRRQCLEASLRDWGIGQHGVWGGLVPAGRAVLRRSHDESASLPHDGWPWPEAASNSAP
jgi:hypothetical protein